MENPALRARWVLPEGWSIKHRYSTGKPTRETTLESTVAQLQRVLCAWFVEKSLSGKDGWQSVLPER